MAKYESILNRPKTIFVDTDGVIFRQKDRWPDIDKIDPKADVLSGVREKFLEWEMKGYRIIVVTGRADTNRGTAPEGWDSVSSFDHGSRNGPENSYQ
jgi:histidinol phosphatase-like enzyme